MNEQVRVLQVLATLNRGGAEAVVVDWLRRIDRRTFTFDFVVNDGGTYDFEQEVLDLGGRVMRSPRFLGWNLIPYALWWRRTLADHPEWRIVHGHHTVPGFIYVNVARRMGRLAIVHSHTAGLDRSVSGILRFALRWPLRFVSHVLLACSRDASDRMFGQKASVRVIQNGIDTARFAFEPSQRTLVRAELGCEEALIIGHVGRFSRPKNHKRLLQIFASLVEREPNAVLLLVGDGRLRSEIEYGVQVLGLEGKVHLLGVREDVPSILSAMDVLLFPSFYEGLPVSLVEAQASGLPCVVSDTIARDVDLSGLVVFLPLEAQNDHWVDAILGSVRGKERKSKLKELREAGYDSADVAMEIEDLYRDLTDNYPGTAQG